MGGRKPKRLSDVAAIASGYGCMLETGGKHWKFVKPGCRTYPVVAHNGMRTEIPFKYIVGLCDCMSIPLEAFTDS